MKRLILSFSGGLATVVLSGALLWGLLPLIFAATSGTDAWLGWFPFAVVFPALLLGGFVAARLAHTHRLRLGFLVGVAASGIIASVTAPSGQLGVLLVAVFIGGLLSAVGARLSGRNHVSP